MSCKYVMLRQSIGEGDSCRVAYGVAAVEECGGVVSVLESYGDLSGDEERVRELVRTCNELELDGCHLCDVIDDFLIKL